MSRIRTNFITNRMANGAPTVSNGLVVSGVTTTTKLNVTSDVVVGGGLTVGGVLTYEDVTNVDSVGMITARTDITLGDSIIHLGNTNTKMRFPEDNNISFDTNGNERFRITSDGRLLIGSTSVVNVGGGSNSGYLQIEGTTANKSSFSLINNQNSTQAAVIRFGKTRGTSTGSVTTVADGDALGRIAFAGADGTDLQNSTAVIEARANGTVAGNQIPTDIVFETSATDGSSRNEKFRVTSTGRIEQSNNDEDINMDSAANGQLRLDGVGYKAAFALNNQGLNIYHNSASRAIIFGTNETERLRIASDGVVTGRGELRLTEGTSSVSNGDEIGSLMFTYPSNDNKNAKIVALQNAGTSGADLAFFTRTHGDGTNNDGGEERVRITSAGRVGIGTDSPDEIVEIFKGSTGTYLKMGGDDAQNGRALTFTSGNTSSNGALHTLNATSANGAIAFAIAGTEKMRVDSGGYVSGNVNVPCWFGMQDTQYNIGHATWIKVYNLATTPINPAANNGGWDESSGRFTVQAGQAGIYMLIGGGGIDDIQANDYTQLRFYKNGSGFGPYARHTNGGGGNQISDCRHMIIESLAEGDYVELYINHNEGSTEPTEPNRCFFGGYRLSV